MADRHVRPARNLRGRHALRRAVCASIRQPKHNSLMGLQGQHGERGIAMAALLVGLAVMSVLMTAALPAWRHQAKREKEAELVFRGEQYVRAIRLWEMKMGPGSRPPTFDMMVQQKFLRKKYKDPMSPDGEFQPLFAGANIPQPGRPAARWPGPGAVPAAAAAAASAGSGRSLARSDKRAARASSALPARARKPRSASTTGARTTTSGASFTPAPPPLPEAAAFRIPAAVAEVRCQAAAGRAAAASAQVAAASAQAAAELDRAGKDPEAACRHFRRAGEADGSRRLGTSGTGLRRRGRVDGLAQSRMPKMPRMPKVLGRR